MGLTATFAKRFRHSQRRDLRGIEQAFSRAVDGFRRRTRSGNALALHCAGKTGLRLNIGCGPWRPDGWVNIDYTGDNRTAFFFDARDPLPLADGTVQHIHSEHFLEHLEFEEAERFLAECFRVLEPGRTMRIIVPDLELYIAAYARGDRSFFEKLNDLGGHEPPLETPARVINQMARMWGHHHFAWDFETLDFVLRKAGFQTIERSTIGDAPEGLNIDLTDWWRPAESLYINARR